MKFPVLALCLLLSALSAPAADTLARLVGLLGNATDAQVQLDILRGLRDATQGSPTLAMPAGWETVEPRLAGSNQAEIRALARGLGLKFGSASALQASRALLQDRAADPAQRHDALRALVSVRDATLPTTLRSLLDDPPLRGAAVRALAAFDDPATGEALLKAYPQLGGGERRDALNTLASRPAYARALLAAMESGAISNKDLNAEVIRQLRSLKDDAVNAGLTRVYGAFREVSADKQSEINRYKRLYGAGGSTPGNAIPGRAVFARVCQQCHTLFDVGGKVGPDLTGSNRGDLDYILQNIVDPNAVIPNEYRASTVELKDGRVLTGIVRQPDDRSLVVATATETVTVPRADVAEIQQSQLSMMPEGLLTPLADQEFRDLIYYLSRPGQSPMLATADTASLFFNAHDLALWQGDEALWSVDAGELVGKSTTSLAKPALLKSDLVAGDFHLTFEAKTTGSAAATVFFRGEPLPDGGVKGFRVGVGARQWGALDEPAGRQLPGPAAPANPADWHAIEIVAAGPHLRVSVDGKPGPDLADAAGARQGMIAFALPAGAPGELRLRKLRLEVAAATGATPAKP